MCNVAKVARLELEAKTGKKVVSPLNAKNLLQGEKQKKTLPAKKVKKK